MAEPSPASLLPPAALEEISKAQESARHGGMLLTPAGDKEAWRQQNGGTLPSDEVRESFERRRNLPYKPDVQLFELGHSAVAAVNFVSATKREMDIAVDNPHAKLKLLNDGLILDDGVQQYRLHLEYPTADIHLYLPRTEDASKAVAVDITDLSKQGTLKINPDTRKPILEQRLNVIRLEEGSANLHIGASTDHCRFFSQGNPVHLKARSYLLNNSAYVQGAISEDNAIKIYDFELRPSAYPKPDSPVTLEAYEYLHTGHIVSATIQVAGSSRDSAALVTQQMNHLGAKINSEAQAANRKSLTREWGIAGP